jgi:hypothetical protein
MPVIHCRECGVAHNTPRYLKAFCSDTCKRNFNNRRQQRGAQLYDAMMIAGYESNERIKEAGVPAKAHVIGAALMKSWIEEDAKARGGRPSWGDPYDFVHKNVRFTVQKVNPKEPSSQE